MMTLIWTLPFSSRINMLTGSTTVKLFITGVIIKTDVWVLIALNVSLPASFNLSNVSVLNGAAITLYATSILLK